MSERFRVVSAGGTRWVMCCANLFGNYHFYCNSVLQDVTRNKKIVYVNVRNENQNFYEVCMKFNYNTKFKVY